MASRRVLICGFCAFPAAPRNPAQAAIEALAAEAWSPSDATAAYLTLPVAWRGSAETVLEHLAAEPFDAVLVVGVAVEADAFRVETLARNVVAQRPDDAGKTWHAQTVVAGHAELIPVTAPAAEMLAALQHAGLPSRLSQDAGDYLCNFTLYRLLAVSAAPQVAFLHVPQARECAAGADFTLAQIADAVRACAEAMTRQRLRVT